MAQLKLILPASKAADHHDKGKARSHSLTAAELAVVQRFAPPMPARNDPRPSEPQRQAATERPPIAEQPPAPPPVSIPAPAPAVAGFALTPGMRLLIGGLIAAALIPNLILGAVFLFSVTGSSPATPEMTTSATDTARPPAVLTAPPTLDATAGEEVPFPIALDGTDGLPARSIIAISGLPHGASFSDGRPYGETEWNLRSDQIGDLRLILPGTANGEARLAIKLIAPDEKVVAEAETTLRIAPAPTAQAEAPAGADAALAAIQDNVGVEERLMPQEAAVAQPGDAASTPAEEAAEPQSGAEDQPPAIQPESDESPASTVQPSAYVNLRDGPSSSSRVIGVIAKGAKLSLTERKRGWLRVTDPASSKEGWIYSGYVDGAKKSRPRVKRTARTQPEQQKSESSFWSSVGRWLGGSSAGTSAKSSN